MRLRVSVDVGDTGDLDDVVRKSWLHAPETLATIGDLHAHVRRKLGLSCHAYPELHLVLDGYVLPPGQPMALLRDGDLVHVQQQISSSSASPSATPNVTTPLASGIKANERVVHVSGNGCSVYLYHGSGDDVERIRTTDRAAVADAPHSLGHEPSFPSPRHLHRQQIANQ